MSSVKLTTFAIYRKPGRSGRRSAPVAGSPAPTGAAPAGPDLLYGATAAEPILEGGKPTGNFVLTAGSVPLGPGQLAPKSGIYALYGFRDTIEELKRSKDRAREMGAEFRSMDIEVDVGTIPVGVVDRKHLKEDGSIRFANLRRTTAKLQSEILDRMYGYVEEENAELKALPKAKRPDRFFGFDQSLARIQQIGQRPELLDRVMEEDRDLKNIDVLVVTIMDETVPFGFRQLAYVRPRAVILDVSQNRDADYLKLPKGFGKAPKADKAV